MNIYRLNEGTVDCRAMISYLTISAILVLMTWMVSAIRSATAADASLATKTEAKIGNAENALSPRPDFLPEDVVRIQLDALANNDSPYKNAGIEIAFRFASPANKESTGPLDRFIQLVHNPAYQPMLGHQTARLNDLGIEDDQAFLSVLMTASDGERIGYLFMLSKQVGGEYDQCWMTDAVLRFEVSSV